ncbi:MAG: MarR family transcriptional regulator [Bacteroidetes bacterium]|nr:MarR family transcriptional regulator [Bacteroidota bacterium]
MSTIIFTNFSVKSLAHISVGTRALILSKLYYGVLTKSLEHLDVDRYFAVLYYIHEHTECCCQQRICDDLVIDKTAMVKVLDHLSKLGLIEKRVNPDDRREFFIHLSKKGEKQTKEIIRTFETVDFNMFHGVSDSDRTTFITVLHTVTENLKNMPSNSLFFNYKSPKKKKSVKKTKTT